MSNVIPREVAVEKLTRYIDDGKVKSQAVVQSLLDEADARIDDVVSRDYMSFRVLPDEIDLSISTGRLEGTHKFNDWSLDQLRKTVGVPAKFLQGLQADGHCVQATDLLDGLRDRIGDDEQNGKSKRRLLRVVHNEIRGWLSPSYKILDQSILVKGLVLTIAQSNAMITDGTLSDRRYALTGILPQVLEPIPGEWVVPGVTMRSSDYGGAFEIAYFLMRLVCINGAMGQTVMRKIHRGGEYGEEKYFEISQQTKELSAAALVSEMTDAVGTVFSQNSIQRVLTAYAESATRTINPDSEAKRLRDVGVFTESDAAQSVGLIALDQPELLPTTEKKESALRWGNVLALMANQNDGEKRLVLEEEAGRYLLPKKG